MENIAEVMEIVPFEDPAWLSIMLEESLLEVEDGYYLMGSMIGDTGRAIIWTMCEYFHCLMTGVPSHTCRVLERYLAHLFRIGILDDEHEDMFNYMSQRLMLITACCFEIATNTTSSADDVRPQEIRTYLASCGYQYSIAEILATKIEINRGLNFRVPEYNSIEMAEHLADYLNVDRNMQRLINWYVQLAELRRPEIETEVQLIASMLNNIPFCIPRVLTVHLAAACVTAAIKIVCSDTSNNAAICLATILQVSGSYIMILRDVFILLILDSLLILPF